MSSKRIETTFADLRAANRPALITFITAGDPDLMTSQAILNGMPEAGADLIELGMPFSDPMAEGPPIQLSSQRALAAGQTMAKTFSMVQKFRENNQVTPIILMGYYNPIYIYGVDTFLDKCADVGVDGLIVVDLPPEADEELCIPAGQKGISFIRLATPTTDNERLPTVLNNTSGFVYYVSITGITGSVAPDANSVAQAISRIKAKTELPVAVGFGVKSAEQARELGQSSDGVVVGSALVSTIKNSLDEQNKATNDTTKNVLALVSELAHGVKEARCTN